MPSPVTTEHKTLLRKHSGFNAFYVAIIILAFHWSIVLYINSAYLEQFLSESDISLLYTLGAIVTILLFFAIPKLLKRFGNYQLTLAFGVFEAVALIGMAFAHSAPIAALWFTFHSVVIPILYFYSDIFMESLIGNNEDGTGSKRGFLLMTTSLMGSLATLASGFLIGSGEPRFFLAYSISALTIVPFLIIIMKNFRNFRDPDYPRLPFKKGLSLFLHHKDIRNVFGAHFLLQVFFVWMVIYTPLYLVTEIGFDWEKIGSILFVALLAYVFFEYPIGIIADKWYGEKEMMALGFLIIALSTSWIAFIEHEGMIGWMAVLFLTRVGGSLVETTTESYFFKQVAGKDATYVSLFRITRPLSYVAGALLGSMTLLFLPFNLLFIVLAFLMIPGFFFAMALHDTK